MQKITDMRKLRAEHKDKRLYKNIELFITHARHRDRAAIYNCSDGVRTDYQPVFI